MTTEGLYFEKSKGLTNFSLLYPPGVSSDGHAAMDAASFLALGPAAAHDLGLEEIVAAFTPDRGHQKEIRDLFSRLPRDPEVIAYRQAVLDDLLANPALAERFASLLPVIDSLFNYSYRSEREIAWLHEVVWRVGELQNIIDCFEGMGEPLGSVKLEIRPPLGQSYAREIAAQYGISYQQLENVLSERGVL